MTIYADALYQHFLGLFEAGQSAFNDPRIISLGTSGGTVANVVRAR